MKIYKLETVSKRIIEAFESLIPQLTGANNTPSKEDIESIVASENTVVFVSEENRKVIGMLSLVLNKIPTGEKVWIEDVVVDAQARGLGVGKKLMQFALAYCKEKDIKQVNLTSSPERIPANKLYLKLGFFKRQTNVYRIEVK